MKLGENSEEISSVALLSPACLHISLTKHPKIILKIHFTQDIQKRKTGDGDELGKNSNLLYVK